MITLHQIQVNVEGRICLSIEELTIRAEDHVLITGPSGSGKSILARVLMGTVFYHGTVEKPAGLRMQYVSQQHQFKNLSNINDFYYQQRFQSQDADDALSLKEYLTTIGHALDEHAMGLLARLRLTAHMNKPMLQLSNGENKRTQLALALLQHPDLLILDAPFIGLDPEGRATLQSILGALIDDGKQLILIGGEDEIPAWITQVVYVEGGVGKAMEPVASFQKHGSTVVATPTLPIRPKDPLLYQFNEAVSFDAIRVCYGDKVVVSDVSWSVKKGERWNLRGANGAGKSTLLSLITGDHPQAYANKINLFDQKRGSGESIWDIKRKIGYVSPELHLYFSKVCTCLETVGSGLFDTIGLFKRLSEEQDRLVRQWLDVFGLHAVADKPLYLLSLSQQRLALLARALIKQPPLLILDEPCQGLDVQQTAFFNQVIDRLCEDTEVTLIYVTHYHDQVPRCVNKEKVL